MNFMDVMDSFGGWVERHASRAGRGAKAGWLWLLVQALRFGAWLWSVALPAGQAIAELWGDLRREAQPHVVAARGSVWAWCKAKPSRAFCLGFLGLAGIVLLTFGWGWTAGILLALSATCFLIWKPTGCKEGAQVAWRAIAWGWKHPKVMMFVSLWVLGFSWATWGFGQAHGTFGWLIAAGTAGAVGIFLVSLFSWLCGKARELVP